jgi:hypothetical protein
MRAGGRRRRTPSTGVIHGNVSAPKAYIALAERHSFMPDVPGKANAAPKLGKKEQLAADAQSGHQDSGWGDLLH